jgi:ABC-type bacteriocin/lantibiotic exporter with double-glycine peptidase domain
MTIQKAFPLDDPLFNAAPTLKEAMFPTLTTFNHEQALLSCFEALCYLNNAPGRPGIDPFSRTVEEIVMKMADSCGMIGREINIHKINLAEESCPAIMFEATTAMPGLIYYKAAKAYLYEPSTGKNDLLQRSVLKNYQMMGIMLYKKLPHEAKTIKQIVKAAYSETHKELKRFFILQGGIALIMLLQPYLTGIIFDDIIKLQQYSLIDQVFLGFFAAIIGSTFFKVVQNYAIIRLQAKGSVFLTSALWNRALSFHLRFFKLFRIGDTHERLVAVDHIQEELTTSTMNAFCQGLFSIVILLFVTIYIPLLGGIVLLATLLFGLASFVLMKRVVHHHRIITKTNARLLSFLFEAIRSVIKIKTSNSQQRVFHRWLNMEFSKMSFFIRAQYLLAYYHILGFVFPIIIVNSFYFLMVSSDPIITTGAVAAAPTLSIGKFIAVQMALGQYFTSLMGMTSVMERLIYLIPQIERTRPILLEKGEQDGGQKIQTIIQGKITLSNVSFRYDAHGPLILDNVNLTIHPGEWVAVVGPSGAGKSTLVKLILGLESCERGSILFDDIPSQQLDMPTVRQQIGTVLQHTQLLPGSIFDNLRATNPNITEEEMLSLLKHVALYDDVVNMPMGLSTVIMGDGRTFSMGQRQRLVLARCLAKPISLILLDEATSSLDNFSQDIVLNTLKQVPITRITVAHRASTIREADRIITLDQGRIV